MKANIVKPLSARLSRFARSRRVRIALVFLVLDCIILVTLSIFSNAPELTEGHYSRGLYPVLLSVVGPLGDLLTFSLQEIVIAMLSIGAITLPILEIVRLIRKKSSFKASAGRLFFRVFTAASLIFIVFYTFWGFNYSRIRFTSYPQYDKAAVTPTNFGNLFSDTIHKVNTLHPATTGFSNAACSYPELHAILSEYFQKLDGQTIAAPRKVKTFATSVFEEFPYSGVTLPFLYEAHISKALFPFERPFIAAHEKCHLFGRAMESEANFLAYQACLASTNKAVRYSGHFMLLRYLFASLKDKNRQKQYYQQLVSGVQKHFQMINERIRSRNRFLREASRKAYNSYLKSQRIKEGIENYKSMTRLVLGFKWPPAPLKFRD